ncbi:MAG: four helix bundle protein [Owenweeksia sp.]
MQDYKSLIIWQKSRALVKQVYQAVTDFPSQEMYGLSSQIKRCTISIPSNIAEGAGRNSPKEFLHFLSISQGSAFELETQIYLAYDLNFLHHDQFSSLTESILEIQKMNRALQKSIRNKPTKN